jgi:hypothetical protein
MERKGLFSKTHLFDWIAAFLSSVEHSVIASGPQR